MQQDQTPEQKDHYSPDRNHWCIVCLLNQVPFYYTGYFGTNTGSQILQPKISIDFNDALKMHSKIAAQQVLTGLKSCSKADGFIIQDHKWM